MSEKKAEGCKSNHVLNKIRQAFTVLTSNVQIIVFLQLGSCEVDALNVSSTLYYFSGPRIIHFLFIGLPVANPQGHAQSRNEKQHSSMVFHLKSKKDKMAG